MLKINIGIQIVLLETVYSKNEPIFLQEMITLCFRDYPPAENWYILLTKHHHKKNFLPTEPSDQVTILLLNIN